MKELKLYVIKYNNGDVNEWEEEFENSGYLATKDKAENALKEEADYVLSLNDVISLEKFTKSGDIWVVDYCDKDGNYCDHLEWPQTVYIKEHQKSYYTRLQYDNKLVIDFDGEREWVEEVTLVLSDRVIQKIKEEN